MDIIKIIQSLQDFMYELVVWVLMLPKTILRAVFRPGWMVSYVNEEWEKKAEERFDDYLSPALFLLIVAVVPNTLFNWMGRATLPTDLTAQLTENNLVASTLAVLTCLLVFLFWLQILSRRPVKRSMLKRLFFIQCYLVAPAQLIYLILAFLGLNTIEVWGVWVINIFVTTFYEAFAFRDELKIGWFTGWIYAVLPYGVVLILWGVLWFVF
ncbi:MAG TPA: hypothetical protein PKL78_00115 [Anaerolineales bacterium]|nr:hypothetical protein [Anaerolineales bacterium]HNN11931.1 hypothetical protein [Anaerolineales bacterium]HNO30981.1 hypothetical protein [Anaerolineales bacterium]